MSTVGTLHPEKDYFTENIEAALHTIIGYCLLGDETEALFTEDQNAFITTFLDTSAEQMTSISIRMSVIELLEDFFFQNTCFEKQILYKVLQDFYFGNINADFIVSKERMAFVIGIENVMAMPLNFVCLPSGNASKKTEVAVYLMGQIHESFSIPYETIV